MLKRAALVSTLVVLGACGASTATQARLHSESTAVPSATALTSRTTDQETTMPPRSNAGTTSSHTTVHSDGGDIEVHGDGSTLLVDAITAAPGWTVTSSRPDTRQLDAHFVRGTSTVDVHVAVTANGITSTTSARAGG